MIKQFDIFVLYGSFLVVRARELTASSMHSSRRFVVTALTLFSMGIFVPILVMNLLYVDDKKALRCIDTTVKTHVNPSVKSNVEEHAAIKSDVIHIAVPSKTIKADNKNAPFAGNRDIRVLCWIMTAPEFLWTRAVHVRNTWGHSCNVLLFASDYKDDLFSTINITVPHGREYLPTKTFKTFDYIYKTHLNDSEWFFKADDDTYTYMESLRSLLKMFDSNTPVYIGYQWMKYAKQGYPSGGAGYILSKEALRRFGNRPAGKCSSANGDEDVKMGLCMEKLGVKAVFSKLLNPFAPKTYTNIGANTITLHYVPP